MNDSEIVLATEKAIGKEYEHAWNTYVKPYFIEKQEDLYNAFLSTPSTDEKKLILIKLQSNVLSGLKEHFLHFIQTGHMAEKQLEEI